MSGRSTHHQTSKTYRPSPTPRCNRTGNPYGGRLLRIVEKSTDRELVRHEPAYDEHESIVSIPVFDDPQGLPVSASTDYKIEATYRNPGAHALRGMGIVVALVEPEGGAPR